MGTTYLQYDLPEQRIAQYPVGLNGTRSESKLLRLRKSQDAVSVAEIQDELFEHLPELLSPGDLLILNNTKVLPARFFVDLEAGKGELFLIQRQEQLSATCERWIALARPMRKFRQGLRLPLGSGLIATIQGRASDGRSLDVELFVEGRTQSVAEALAASGGMPIPPYIRGGHAEACDKQLYQTVFASVPGSVAAPTAGLHFTDAILRRCAANSIEHSFLTLHVGPASFLPVTEDDLSKHPMPEEHYWLGNETIHAIRNCKNAGGRIVAVGTTSVRTLESAALANPGIFDISAELAIPDGGITAATALLISPGFTFNVVDALITNFHQPRSTHLLLVAAFVGEQAIDSAYTHALGHDYRFLSYGDSMLLERQI